MVRSILDVLYPPACAGCRGGGWPFCERCRRALAALDAPWCERCGRPLDDDVAGCADCPPPEVRWARSAFVHDGPARCAVMRLKFGGVRSIVDALALAMAARLPPLPEAGAPVLTWVPLGRRRRRARGYDQAEALARAVGRATGLPVRRCLRRARETDPQARRTGEERRRALAGAFEARPPVPAGVMLVDDVLTTGATAAACARALLDAGASAVGLLTATRSLGGRVPARCYNPDERSLGLWLPERSLSVVDASRRRNDPRKATLGR